MGRTGDRLTAGAVYGVLAVLLLAGVLRSVVSERGGEGPAIPGTPDVLGPGSDSWVDTEGNPRWRPDRRPSVPTDPPLSEESIPDLADPTFPAPDPDCAEPSRFSNATQLAATLGPPSSYDQYQMTANGGGGSGISSYSGTNNQVAGVDEPDIVKTDGRFIYYARGRTIAVIDASPPDSARLSGNLTMPGSVRGLFLNGDRLVVLWASYVRYSMYNGTPFVHLHVYVLGGPAGPTLWTNVTTAGYWIASRMIRDDTYTLVRAYAYGVDGSVALPAIIRDGVRQELAPSQIAYFEDSQGSTALVIAFGLNIRSPQPLSFDAFLAPGGFPKVYVSATSAYFASAHWSDASHLYASLVHRVAIAAGRVCYVASGEVPGSILNQFSMDEHGGYLRVATTTGGFGTWRNALYVLDAAMVRVGTLEGIAPGETIYSARFLGDRGYLVTFKKVDPLFAIDLSDPRSPRILGYLKIPGYSTYLHPYDGSHLIGLGKDAVDMGTFAWYQGLKLSLFEVSDASHPAELSNITIGDRGTDSAALFEHKAFLFVPSRSLVVLPVSLAVIDRIANPNPRPDTFGKLVWIGAYALSVTVHGGIDVLARITHTDAPSCGSWWTCYGYRVVRSLYIGDVLFTFSSLVVRMTDLDTFQPLGSIPL